MIISFVTPNRISLINLTTIGDSEKRKDATKFGQFSSGQAYATALLLRDGVKMSVTIYGGTESFEVGEDSYRDETYTEDITYSTLNKVCDSTGKSKEIIVINYEKSYHGRCNSSHDFHEPREGIVDEIETAFALQLGYNWEIWMALRELWANMLDEGGYIEENIYSEIKKGTVISLEFDENNEFYNVWQNRHLYINEKEPLFVISDRVEALENPEGYLRIYKQNILVYEDKDRLSKYAYNCKFGTIDERRILSNVYSVEQDIANAIMSTKSEDFLREIITADFKVENNEFLSSVSAYCSVSDLANQIASEVYNVNGEVNSFPWLIDAIKNRKDCSIGGRKLNSVTDHIYSYSGTTTIETHAQCFSTPEVIETPEETLEDSFVSEIKKHYNFNLDVEVKKAKLKGSKAICDKYNNCIIIDEDFDLQEDFASFLVEYIILTQEGNVLRNLSNYVVELLRK